MKKRFIHISIRSLFAGLFLSCSLVYFACEDNVEKGSFISSNDLNISSYLEESEEYSQFAVLLKEAGLFDALNSYNPYGEGFTVFVPTNEAIQNYISDSDYFNSLEDLITSNYEKEANHG